MTAGSLPEQQQSGKTRRGTRQKPVVISSITGKPMPLPVSSERIIPHRANADLGNDSNDARLLQDVPPHWGR